ncbi:hypothetical protein BOX15_Mlig006831g1, partial [Macrostomum lignano]
RKFKSKKIAVFTVMAVVAPSRPVIQCVIVALICLIAPSQSQNTAPTFSQCSGFNTAYATGPCSSLVQLKEEIPIDTVLFTLEAADSENDDVEFTIIGDSTLIYMLKLVTNKAARTANVVVNSRIDRESLSSALLTLQLRMNDFNGNIINNPSILIFINDINDNSPEFQNLPYRWEVPENTLGTSQTSFNVSLIDKDVTVTTYKLYYVSPDASSGMFNQTYYSSAALTSQSGHLYTSTVSLLQSLDYETTRFYQVSVYAVEQPTSGGRNTTADIVLNVLDQQDTPPIFDGAPYVASVTENALVGTLVATITARDGDRGVPNPVGYYFDTSASSTVAQLAALFSLDNTTGRVEVAASIDRESALITSVYASFTLTVLAVEVSGTAQPANISTTSTSLQITVLDVNDATPTFSQSNYNATVLENTAIGIPVTLLTTCTVTDSDDKDNSVFNLTVSQNGSTFGVFDVSPTSATGSATVSVRVADSSQLDYETVKSFVFEIVARETKTAAKLSSIATFTVFLLDANDNAPEFNQSKYTYSISENSPNGTIVGQVAATDRDSGSYGAITFSLGGTNANKFRIDPNTGLIRVNVNADSDLNLLDRETYPVMLLSVQAMDGGGLTRTVQLEISLEDRNDKTPTFQRTVYEGSLYENSLSFDVAVQVAATDLDLSPNNIISYSLLATNSSYYFSINNATGVLSVQHTTDYEALSNKTLYLWVVATDHGAIPLSSTTEIRIAVNDQNDKTPQCSQDVYNVTALETANFGTVIATLAGSDGDSLGSPNSQIFFRIVAGAGDRFTLDVEGTRVIVERGATLDYVNYGSFHNLTVGIFDRGVPQLTSSCLVYVNVIDVNNQAPYFNPIASTITVSEGIALNTAIMTPPKTAIDVDSTANLSYSLLSHLITGRSAIGAAVASTSTYNFSTLFAIDSNNGTIVALSALDREKAQELTIPIFVTDLNAATPTPVQTATGTIVLTLTDINNKYPRFLSVGPANNFTLRLSESSEPPLAINLKLQADDPDTSTTSLTFGISPASSYFSIDSSTGQVTLIKKLDYESQTLHVFHATVSDGLHVTTATVSIEVLNANTYDPVFDVFPSPIAYLESITLGTVVATVHAYDNDSGAFGVVEYALVSGDTFFSIQPSTGQITLKRALDRDVSGGDQHILVVQAIDNPGGIDRRQSSRQMIVNVLDVNDCPPTFRSANYSYTRIRESYQIGYEIDSLGATDKDAGINSALHYELTGMPGQSAKGLDLFNVTTINATDGYYAKLMINSSLNGQTGWYNLTLIARDGGTPQLTGTTALTFYVAPAEQGSAVDDSALARFRNALISTTIILIAGCAVSLLFMIRTYLKSRNMMRVYNGLDDNRAAHRPSSSSISWSKDNSVGPMADKEATPKPAAQTPPSKGLPEVEKPAMLSQPSPAADFGLSEPDTNPFDSMESSSAPGGEFNNPAEGNALFPREFTLLKISPAGGQSATSA